MTKYLIHLEDNDRLGTLYKVENSGTIEVELSRDGGRETYQINLIEKDILNWGLFITQEWNLCYASTFDQSDWMMLDARRNPSKPVE